jgi:hypothetical protein
LAAAALRFVIYPTNEPEGDRAGFFRARAARWREQDVPVLFFHCSGIVFHCYCRPVVTARRTFCPHSAGFLRGRDRRDHC